MNTLSLGEKIKSLRKKNGMTQKELAKAIPTSFSTFRRWEKENHVPDIKEIARLAEILNTSISYLIGTENNSHSKDINEQKEKFSDLIDEIDNKDTENLHINVGTQTMTYKNGEQELTVPYDRELSLKILMAMLNNEKNPLITAYLSEVQATAEINSSTNKKIGINFMAQKYKVIYYKENGKNIIKEWLKSLRDLQGRKAIDRAILRLEKGNFGDHKFCRDGVSELRIHVNAGYRVYYSINGNEIILLLNGGSKSTQNKDIDKAIEYLKKFKEEQKCQ